MNVLTNHELWKTLVQVAGVVQVGIGLASLAIPKILRWSEDLARVGTLTRQVFWVYAVYILFANVAFGIVSLLAAPELLNGSIAALAITGFIGLWWGARLGIQFFYFDKSAMPNGAIYRWMSACLLSAFAFLATVYGVACVGNVILLKP